MSAELSKRKVYIPVNADFDAAGNVLPRSFMWEDGRVYEIDKLLGVQPAAAQKSGGQGTRYTIRVMNQTRYIYFEHNSEYGKASLGRWFIER
ncbi:hypothetical protein FACS1894184_09020 [Clostridia bacterium]|nr:hypothetical protein FACS1894184_09020 [Clostridia bacterium]